jgi:hypothetical protein
MTAIAFIIVYLVIPFIVAWLGIHRRTGRPRHVGIGVLSTYLLIVLVVGPLLGTVAPKARAVQPTVHLVSTPSASNRTH